MRKYTRKPIRLTDVSGAAVRPTITMPKRDDIDAEVERLKASGWLSRKAEPVADDTDFVGFTYTGLSFPSAKPKRKDKSHDVVVVKRKRELGERTERRGKIFTNRNGFAD